MNSSDKSAKSVGGKTKLYLGGVAAVVVLGAVLYFAGLQAGRSQLAAQASKFEVERNGLNSKFGVAQNERDAARGRAALMEARAALYRTAIDLEARNFGIANTHLKEAARALGQSSNASTDELRREIEATDLKVAVDLAGQRAKVLSYADQLNKLVPVEIETTAPAVASSPDNAATSFDNAATLPDNAATSPDDNAPVAP